jgi:hypothetical protein
VAHGILIEIETWVDRQVAMTSGMAHDILREVWADLRATMTSGVAHDILIEGWADRQAAITSSANNCWSKSGGSKRGRTGNEN